MLLYRDRARSTRSNYSDLAQRVHLSIWAITTLAASLLAAPAAYSQTERFSANLVGANEVPSINTAGSGEFRMQIVGSDISFSLSFSDLSSALTVAHLHFADSNVAGGVMIFLCGGGGQPDCPAATSGTITETITAANVTGPTTQGIAVADVDSALEAVRAGLSYANMHTVNFAAGEIRGQVQRGSGHAIGGE